ncbi:MAG: MFS transporter, partial [Actinomycetota bacterium]
MKAEDQAKRSTAGELEEAGIPDEIARPQAAEPNFLKRGRASFRQVLKEAANFKELRKTPYGLKPALVILFMSMVITVDGSVLLAAIPEISQDLDIALADVVEVLITASFFLILAAIGIAYMADRVRRVPIVGISAIIAGLASLLSTRVTVSSPSRTVQFGGARAFDNLGRLALDAPIDSLQADYYPPESRGKVFALRGVAIRAILLAAPLTIALLATATDLSWRLPYLIFGPMIILGGILTMILLREPIRGYMERKAMGAPEEVARIPEEPPSIGEAWRTVWSVRTLRRLFIADIPTNAGDIVYGIFIVAFLFQEYQLDIRERAYLSTAVVAFALPIGFLSGGFVDVLLRRRPHRVLVFSGLLAVGGSFAVLAISQKPPLLVLVALLMVFGGFTALLGPARSVLFVQILPAHVRTMGVAVRLLAAIPATIIWPPLVGPLLNLYGVQGAIAATFPFFLIGAIIELSAAGLFERDMRAAVASQIASDEWRRAKEEGRGKLLVCREVDVEYDGVQVLFGVDFDVEEGEIIGLLGTNGAGKSTLLRAISGTQEASLGAIVFDGRDITHMPPHEIASRGVIHMPGGRGVFPGLTVRDNILLGTWIGDPKEEKKRLEEVYQIFPVLKERHNQLAGSLSGGEQQMVSLAQALLGKPRLLMIDELSLGLSPAVVQQLVEVIRKIHESGVTVILVEQSVNVALTLAERCIFMEKGEVRFFGDTRELLRRPDILRAVYVKGSGALTEGGPTTALKSERDLRAYEISKARPILEVRDISRAYGGVKAVDRVSFELREGEALGFIGPNGAGKTTLFDLISGYQPPDSGTIIFDGVDVTGMRADERANRRLVRRFQDARLFPSLTTYENILVALDRKLDIRNTILTAMQLPQVRQSERRVRLRAERLLELLELGAYRDKFVKELSTGLRRITDLACVLASEPRVLMLDEPSSGIAQAEAEGLAALLRRVRFETGASMLIIEHDMPLISAISD